MVRNNSISIHITYNDKLMMNYLLWSSVTRMGHWMEPQATRNGALNPKEL